MMLKRLLLILILGFQCLHAEEYDGYTYNDFDFSMITMRKSGTHMMKKLFHILSEELGHPEAKRYYWDHFGGFRNQRLTRIRDQLLENKPTLLIVRDLRDIAVSLVSFVEIWIDKGYFNDQYSQEILVEWSSLPMEKKIEGVITGNSRYPFVNYFLDQDYTQIGKVFKQAKNRLVVKYENLVGLAGGSTNEIQKKELDKIVQFLHISLTEDELDYLCQNLFGVRTENEANTLCYTFNPESQGKIGTWRKHFTPYLQKLIKEKYRLYFNTFKYDL